MKGSILASLAALVPTMVSADLVTYEANPPTVHVPLQVPYGRYGRPSTLLSPKYNPDEKIETVYDLGGDDFIMFEKGSIMNWGCGYMMCEGPCNVSVPANISYDPALSTTRTDEHDRNVFYPYGSGLSKIYYSNETVNDTFILSNEAGFHTELPNVQVGLIQRLQQRIRDNKGTCDPDLTDPRQPNPFTYTKANIGLAPYSAGTSTGYGGVTGPSFRRNLLNSGAIAHDMQSMWFDKLPEDPQGLITGNGLLGAIDTSKYEGPLVKIPKLQPKDTNGLAYWANPPNISIDGTAIEFDWSGAVGGVDPACLFDSGYFSEGFNPVNLTHFLEVTGLAQNPKRKEIEGSDLAWPGACNTIPEDRSIEYTFIGLDASQPFQIKIPLKVYQRYQDPADEALGWCTMAIHVYGCTLGSIFISQVFFAADDTAGVMALAQGAVSKPGSGIDYSSLVTSIP